LRSGNFGFPAFRVAGHPHATVVFLPMSKPGRPHTIFKERICIIPQKFSVSRKLCKTVINILKALHYILYYMQLCLRLKSKARRLFDEISKNIGILHANIKRLHGSHKNYSKELIVADLREANKYVRGISDGLHALIKLLQKGKGLNEKIKK